MQLVRIALLVVVVILAVGAILAADSGEHDHEHAQEALPSPTPVAGATRLDLQELSQLVGFDEAVPPQWAALDGQTVVVTGYVLPVEEREEPLAHFFLMGDIGGCCSAHPGGTPYHMIEVMLPISVPAIPWEGRVATIEGTLEVGEKQRDGELWSIYRIVASRAEGHPIGDAAATE